jgi:hypothetical protein
MILCTDGRKVRPAQAGQTNEEGLVKIRMAGLFLYCTEYIGIEVDDLLDEPLAVNVAELRRVHRRASLLTDCTRLPLVVMWSTAGSSCLR